MPVRRSSLFCPGEAPSWRERARALADAESVDDFLLLGDAALTLPAEPLRQAL